MESSVPPPQGVRRQAAEFRRANQPREFSADLYRASALVLIVIGHWLAASVTFRDGRFDNEAVLAVVPWTQWLTWIFQVVPLFFLVAGYANAVSWTRWRVNGDVAAWYRHRMAAVLGPTTVYIAAVLSVVAALLLVGVNASQVAFASWAVALHLWFLPVYLLVVALTPMTVAACERWGLTTVAALGVAVMIVDIAVHCADFTAVGLLNYLLCWAAVYQIGIAWHAGELTGRGALVLAIGSAGLLTALLALRLYPVSMVGVAGQPIQNTSPPTLAMLAFSVMQCALAVASAPAISRWLTNSTLGQRVRVANRYVMGLYLWHMIPVVVLSLIAYPAGLLAQPAPGSPAWWWWRLVWVASLSALTAAEMALIAWRSKAFIQPLPRIAVRIPQSCTLPMQLAALGFVVVPLWHFAAHGFAPGGRFPTWLALLYGTGVTLVVLVPRISRTSAPTVGGLGNDQMRLNGEEH